MPLEAARWVDTIINEQWEALQLAGVPFEDLPDPKNVSFNMRQQMLPGMSRGLVRAPKRLSFKEFGCGHYGCVMPTIGNPELVVKLTSDITEAMFVGHLLTDTPQPEQGLVRYERMLAMPGARRNRPVFLIWREEAFHVGELQRFAYARIPGGSGYDWLEPHKQQAIARGGKYLEGFLEAAGIVKQTMDRMLKKNNSGPYTDNPRVLELYGRIWDDHNSESYHDGYFDIDKYTRPGMSREFMGSPYPTVRTYLSRWRGYEKVLHALDVCTMAAQHLVNTDVWYTVGSAFSEMLDAGFLLADVHWGNLGLNGDGDMIVTDPGHVVPFNPERAGVPEIEAI